MLVGNSAVMDIDARSRELNKAEAMVMQLDTRASELKVDGYKALVRSDPEAQLEELAGDIATAEELLAVLETAELSGETAEAVDGVVESFGPYTEAIGVFIDSAIADQPGTTARWEEIQVANDITDGAVGAAKDLLISESIAAEQELTDTIARTQTISLLIAAAALLVIVGMSWLTLRSIKRPVERVKASLDALATGDLTVATGVTSKDEVGQMAASLDTAQTNLREVLSAMAGSADAVAASSEELSASSAADLRLGPGDQPRSPASSPRRPRRSPATWRPWPRVPRRWARRSGRSRRTPPRPVRWRPRRSSPRRPPPRRSPSSGRARRRSATSSRSSPRSPSRPTCWR